MFLKLPNELLLHIAEYLEVDELYFWILTAKRFYLSLDDILYTKAVTLDRLECNWPLCLTTTILSNNLPGFKRLLENSPVEAINCNTVKAFELYNVSLRHCSSTPQEVLDHIEKDNKRMDYSTLLHLACFLDRQEMARLIINKGGLPSLIDPAYSTPLHIATLINSLPLMELLVTAGADVSAVNVHKMNPLGYASLRGNVAAVQLFLSAGADIGIHNDRDCSPLHLAAGSPNSVQVARLLIQAGADVSRLMNYKGTPLHCATRKGDMGMTELLLEHGANATALDWNGETVLHGVRGISIAKLLISANKNLASVLNQTRSTPLRRLVYDRSRSEPIEELESVALFLIEAGVSVTTIVRTGMTMGYINNLAEYGFDKIVKAVLEINPRFALTRDYRGLTPLHYAARASSEGMASCVKHLIEAGSKINAVTANNETALHYAVQGKQPHIRSVVQLLLRAGVNISAQTMYGETALHVALLNNNPEIALDLIEAGIDVFPEILYRRGRSSTQLFHLQSDGAWFETRSPGRTALHCAARFGYFDVVKCLVKRHIDISATDVGGDTALHLAVRESTNRYHSVEGYVNMMALILLGNHSASVSDVNGQTSLHDLTGGGYMAIVKHLLASGADAAARNSEDCSPLEIASRRSWRRVPNAALNNSEDIRRQLGPKPDPKILRWLGVLQEKDSAVMESLEDLFGDAEF